MKELIKLLLLCLKGVKLDKCDKEYETPHYNNCEEKKCDNYKEFDKKDEKK